MNNRLMKCYAGWLGKLAGIRLGAPIEGWTYEKIRREVGEIDGYVTDMSRFAADDDSNGPMLFIRALSDYSVNATAEEIGRTWLNYAPYEHGMFWWGGYGVSTEHTAYLNLAAGIPAPRSGSIEQNGAAVAEQIGGQIFIDTWGLVNPGNPRRAAEMARKAASVSHDGEGIYGGVFVAAAIALAFDETDIKTVIKKALSYIPENCAYARVVRSVSIFHDERPDSWRECFDYVKNYFGYDRYPGNCHIIPNAAVMALSMLYGDGDFTRTLNISCMCGWDTDCNAGNVGAILGVLNGIEGIDREKWLAPINDGFAVSGVMGSLNYMDAPWCAKYLDMLAREIAGEEPSGFDPFIREYKFDLPGSTHSFESLLADLTHENGKLKCVCPGRSEIFRRSYHAPDYFADDRYSPESTPEIWPGQRAVISVSGKGVSVRAFAWDMLSGRLIEGEETKLDGETDLTIEIPHLENACIERVGVICEGGTVYISGMRYYGVPDYTLDMGRVPMEKHESLFRSLNQFTRWKGLCDADENGVTLSCADAGAIFTGDIAWQDYEFTAEFIPTTEGEYEMLVRVGGALLNVRVSLSKNGLAIVQGDMERKTLARIGYDFIAGKTYTFTVKCSGDEITVHDNNGVLLAAKSENRARGAVGFGVVNGGRMLIKKMAVKGCSDVHG